MTLLYFKILIYLILVDAALFKTAFEDGQKVNASLGKSADEKVDDGVKKDDQEEKLKKDTEPNAAKDDGKDDGKAKKEEDKTN